MSLSIKITNFEGPFDLLLHLIKKNEMEIYDIRLYEITNQYLAYIKEMKEMDLEVTSEFIVIAATLIEIKSKHLLPKIKVEQEGEEEIDPGQELLNKLLEYKKFKAVAAFLKEKEQEAGIMFAKKPEIIEEPKKEEVDWLKKVTILDLYNLFNELMFIYMNKMNTETQIQSKISVDTYKIEDKMEEIGQLIQKNKTVHFSKVLSTFTSKLEKVVTFLALLELVRLKSVRVLQQGNFNDIYIERVEPHE